MTFEVILPLLEICCLHNVDTLEKFFKRLGVKQKYIAEKDDFEKMILCDL
jgi:hypothetical protein